MSQPDIVEHFRASIAEMDPKVRGHEKMKETASGLESIESLMKKSESVINADVVEEIHKICSTLLDSIRGLSGKEKEKA